MVETLRRRRHLRLPDYDYSQAGAYFLTICTYGRKLWLDIDEIREVVLRRWLWLGDRYEYVQLDEFVIMPNHVHGILVIADDGRGGSRTAPTKRKPLGRLVGAFKTTSAKTLHRSGYPSFAWQRNFYEHIIRNERSLNRIRKYIHYNPLNWHVDIYNPAREQDYRTFADYLDTVL